MLELLEKRHAEAIEKARTAEDAHRVLSEELEAQREQIKAVESKITGATSQLGETDPFSKAFTALALAREQDKMLLAALNEQLAAAEKKHAAKESELGSLREGIRRAEHAVLMCQIRTGGDELRRLVWETFRNVIAPAFQKQAELTERARPLAPQRQWLEHSGPTTWWNDGARLPWVHPIHGRHTGVDPDGDEFLQLVMAAYREQLMVELGAKAEAEQRAKDAESTRVRLELAGSIAG